MSDRIAADLLSELIVESDDFRSLLSKIQCINAELFLMRRSDYLINYDELNHLLRYADIMSHSDNPYYREFAYLIVSLLLECDSAHKIEQGQQDRLRAVTEAVLVQLGNFPGIKTLQATREPSRYALPLSRRTVRVVKESSQRTSKGDAVFSDTQYSVVKKMQDEGFFSFSGPTSLGKSFILKDKLYSLACQDRLDDQCIVVLVPTRALIAQTARDLRRLLKGVPDVNVAVYPSLPVFLRNRYKRTIFVFTPERLLRYLASPVRDISYLVIDEAHKIVDENDTRSSLYYHVTVEVVRRFATKLLFASPSIENPEIFLQLFGKATNGALATRERTVSQQRYFIDLIDRKQYYISALDREMRELEFPFSEGDIYDVILSRSGNDKSIIYVNGSLKSAEFAMELSRRREPVSNSGVDSLIADVKERIHEDYYLVNTLAYGVAFHHGKMPREVREKVEGIFADPDSPVQYVVCTSTLLEGVNLPAKNVFIVSDQHGRRKFSDIDFENLAGRAGRLTYDFSGNVVCIRGNQGQWRGSSRDLILQPESIKADSFLVRPERRRIKECTDIERVLTDQPLPGGSSVVRRQLAEHYASILMLHQVDGQQTLLRGLFLEKIDGAAELLSKKAGSIEVPSDALRRSPGILPQYQERVLRYVRDGDSSPLFPNDADTSRVDTYYSALNVLCKLYEWRTTEVSGRNSLMSKRKSQRSWERKLKYWAMLMRDWVCGYPIRQIIASSIAYRERVGEFTYFDTSQSGKWITEVFDRRNLKHVNIVIDQTLNDIETGLRFSIVRYLQNYYDISDMVLGPSASGIDAATLVEYGTTDRRAIELQEIGFSRDVVKELLARCGSLMTFSSQDELERFDCDDMLKVKELSDDARTELENIMMKE